MPLNQAHTLLLKEGPKEQKIPKVTEWTAHKKVKGDKLLPVPINDVRGKIFDFCYVIIDTSKEFIVITELGLPVDKVTSFF